MLVAVAAGFADVAFVAVIAAAACFSVNLWLLLSARIVAVVAVVVTVAVTVAVTVVTVVLHVIYKTDFSSSKHKRQITQCQSHSLAAAAAAVAAVV